MDRLEAIRRLRSNALSNIMGSRGGWARTIVTRCGVQRDRGRRAGVFGLAPRGHRGCRSPRYC